MKPIYSLFSATLFLATLVFSQSRELNLSSATALFSGENMGDLAGHHVSLLGDINDDSYDDFIITAPGWDQDESSQNNGAAFLFYGKSSGFSGAIDLASADAIFIGSAGQEAAHDAFGIGDVDSDGFNDFAIGLKKYHAVVDDTLRNKLGKVYIFFGGPSKRSGTFSLESADVSLEGTNEYAEAAHVKGVGDVNDDGYDDIIVGAGFHSQIGPEAGKVYLFLGKDRDEWTRNAKMEDVADASFLAESEYDWAGHRVADVGDVNGDGFADFIIGANNAESDELIKNGKVYLILGRKNGWKLNTSLTDASASWAGSTGKMGLGWNVGNPGDVDGDGLNDILVGGNKYDTFLILGKNISLTHNQNINTAADVRFTTAQNLTDDIGHDMHSLGDMNGDMIDDFILGGSKFPDDLLGAEAGKAFVFWGRRSWPSQFDLENADLIFTAEHAGDAAGFSVSGDGDINNDGAVDILIAATHFDNNTGKVYLFHNTEPRLTLTHPNGGEIFSAGDATNITWMTDPDVEQVTLELSTDNGDTWEIIAENIDDTGSLAWSIPNVNSENCLVRIKDALDGEPYDQSNSVFTITNQARITLLSPNGGENLLAGNSFTLQWTSQNFENNIKIELSVDGGLTWDAISPDAVNDGSYEWTVPDRPTSAGFIRIASVKDITVFDTSNVEFTISGSMFSYNRIEEVETRLSGGYEIENRIETSNGKVAKVQNGVGRITYDFNLPPAEYELVVRYLDENDGVSTSIINLNKNKIAEWQWNQAVDTDIYYYRSFGSFNFETGDEIELFTQRDNGEYGRIDYLEFVRLDEPIQSITLLSPNGGEDWEIATTQKMIWSAENTSGFYNVQLTRDAGATWETVANNISITPGQDGKVHLSWPVTGPASDSCLVKVVDADGAPVDQSDDFFSITKPPAPTLTITHPNGGETWYIDSVVTLTWNSENTSGEVKIELSRDNGSNWQTLTTATSDDGDFEWKVAGPEANNCLIRISDVTGDVADQSDAVFTIAGKPTITLSSPNGGENWEVGTTQKIRWTSAYIDGAIKIDLTRDGGESWESIVDNTTNDGEHAWTVTAPETETALLRIAALDGSAADSSDTVFSIMRQPSITVTVPNGGETWAIGASEKIGWISDKVSQNVNIQLSRDGGSTWEILATRSADSDTITHVVNGPSTKAALVRVITEDGSVSDVSNSVFSIIAVPEITITSPNGGEKWQAGTTQKITWDSHQASTSVKIELTRDGGDSWEVITDSTQNSGEFAWLVSPPASDECLVRIYFDLNGAPTDSSDNTFFILEPETPTLTVLSPNGGEKWTIGSPHHITWESAFVDSDVKIELSRNNGADWEVLSSATPNDGDFEWTVSQPASDICLVRISSVDGLVSDQSNSVFSIIEEPAITIQSPNGGERWAVGTNQTIYWTSINSSGAVKIELSRDNGATWTTLIDSTQDIGSFAWKVTEPVSDTCLLMVSDVDGSPFDVSDAFFSIVEPPSINVQSPNGGEVWDIGSEQAITWTSVNVPDTVEIHLSRDNGATWEALIINAVNTGTWLWTVTDPVSESCLIRVALASGDVSDMSDAVFKIDIANGVARQNDEIPTEFALVQNYPNPFNPVTRIQYNVPTRSDVRIEVYNTLGNKIATLVNDTQSAGVYVLTWNGKDDFGNQMSSGIYFYRMTTDGFSQTKRMMLMK